MDKSRLSSALKVCGVLATLSFLMGQNECSNCPIPQSTCMGGYCADLQTSLTNCGACGNVCNAVDMCVNGQCQSPP